MSFRTHAVLVIPGYGHTDAEGHYDHGQSVGRFDQLDVVDGYLPNLIEELDDDGLRVEVMETRKKPGLTPEARAKAIEGHRMVVHLAAGWYDGKLPPLKNISSVFFGSPESKDIAKELAESLVTWGQCYVWGHRTSRPEPMKEDALINAPGTIGIRIEPFILNGPDIDDYMSKLPQLGTCIGRAISSYLRVRSHAKARHTIGVIPR